MSTVDGSAPTVSSAGVRAGTNYKFQRMRERLRAAIASGELTGKLPGERLLAQRFKVNSKTLSKALTDLAAEGVVERVIGRGTFVRGQSSPPGRTGRWLILTAHAESAHELSQCIAGHHADCETIDEVAGIRPSFLVQFSGVIDLSPTTPEWFLRDLMVRNIPVVLVNKEPGNLSLHAVLVDVALGGARLAREMLLGGHRKLMVVQHQREALLAHAVRQIASRYANDSVVETCFPKECSAIMDSDFTGVICDSADAARNVIAAAKESGRQIPAGLSIGAIGTAKNDNAPCSGYFASPAALIDAVVDLLQNTQPSRPTVLWLNGEWHDRGTLSSLMPNSTSIPTIAPPVTLRI